MCHAIRAGALAAEPAAKAQPWTAEQLKALPGRPEAVSVPGHTAGSVALVLPDADAIATGDCLVTGHPLSSVTGPQMLDPMFHSHPGGVEAALDGLGGVEASVILPGHGPALLMPLAQAVAAVRR
jgi:glyoxylase-like metal-dependent hydrolase (beta-lactamase superfamily II)